MVRGGSRVVVLVLGGLVACDKRSDVPAGSDDTSTGVAGETSSSGGSSSTTADAEESTTASDGCFEADSCGSGCTLGTAWVPFDDRCTMNPVPVCLPQADGTADEGRTWWRNGPDGLRFVESGTSCADDASPAADGWTPCSGRDDEPPECACFCTPSWCPSEADHATLEACALPEPCATIYVNHLGPSVDVEAATCVLEAFRDRVPGNYGMTATNGFGGAWIRWFVEGDEVQVVRGWAGDVVSCPTEPRWNPAERCELAPSEYFEACLALVGTEQDCALASADWLVGCVSQAATCPD